MKVLLVAQHDRLRQVLRDIIEDLDMDVVDAAWANDALTALQSHNVAGVVVDIMGPRHDGLHFLEEYEQLAYRAPVLALTPGERSRQTALDLGARICLSKPFDLTEFTAALNSILGLQQEQIGETG